MTYDLIITWSRWVENFLCGLLQGGSVLPHPERLAMPTFLPTTNILHIQENMYIVIINWLRQINAELITNKMPLCFWKLVDHSQSYQLFCCQNRWLYYVTYDHVCSPISGCGANFEILFPMGWVILARLPDAPNVAFLWCKTLKFTQTYWKNNQNFRIFRRCGSTSWGAVGLGCARLFCAPNTDGIVNRVILNS